MYTKIFSQIGIISIITLMSLSITTPVSANTTYNISSCAGLQALDADAPYDSTDIVYITGSFSCDTVIGDVTAFNGTFDGQGNTITLVGDTPLFDELNGATVRNLMIAGDIDGGGTSYVSALATTASNNTLIERVGVIANITNAVSYSAGFVYSLSNSTIQDSFHTGTVSGSGSYISGIASFMLGGSTIQRTFSEGTISGASNAGGIAGLVDRTGGPQVIRDSFFSGSLTSSNSTGGAIAGLVDNTLVADITQWLDNNYYDDDSLTPSVCAKATPDVLSEDGVCQVVDTDAQPDEFYFIDNSDNEPMVSWDFDTIWYTQVPLPRLRILSLPQLISFSPRDNETNVDRVFDIEFTFDQPVAFDAGTITIHRASDDGIEENIAVGGGDFFTSSSVTFLDSLDYGTDYYINISDDAFVDQSGYNFAGVLDTTTWNFTTLSEPQASSSTKRGVRFGCKDPLAENYGFFSRHDQSRCKYSTDTEKVSTGVDDQNQKIELVPSEVPMYPGEYLRQGSRGDSVVWIQEQLNAKNNATLSTDGIFGLNTKAQLLLFQKEQGLITDGIVGPQTWKQLR